VTYRREQWNHRRDIDELETKDSIFAKAHEVNPKEILEKETKQTKQRSIGQNYYQITILTNNL